MSGENPSLSSMSNFPAQTLAFLTNCFAKSRKRQFLAETPIRTQWSRGQMSTIVLELVSDEIHRRRHIFIREAQESDSPANKTCWVADFDSTSKDLETLSLVHKSWTPIAQRCLGRILVLSNVDIRAATTASTASIFGSWTREVYLSSINNITFGAELWIGARGLFRSYSGSITLLRSSETKYRAGDLQQLIGKTFGKPHSSSCTETVHAPWRSLVQRTSICASLVSTSYRPF